MVSYTPDNDNFLGPDAVAVGYFNNDSYIDIVVANYDDQSVGILLGNGDDTFLPEITFFAGNNTDMVAIAVGDFNNDHKLDTVIVNMDNANIIVLLGNGDGTLIVQKAVPTGSGSYPAAVAVGYFNKDNILDIAVANSGNDRVLIFTGNGNGTFQSQKSLQAGGGSSPNGVAVGDFNNDNNTDVAVANWGTNAVGVFLGYGNGSFRSQMTFPSGNVPNWVNVADFNGDRHLDIAVLNMNDNNIGVLLGIGNGTFLTQTTYPVSNTNSTYFFTIADANNDGRWDILIPNALDNNIGILLGRGDGTFGVQITFSTGADSSPSGLAITDFNRDGRSDIVVINYNTDEVGVLLGTC
jgi:hypothetical protein